VYVCICVCIDRCRLCNDCSSLIFLLFPYPSLAVSFFFPPLSHPFCNSVHVSPLSLYFRPSVSMCVSSPTDHSAQVATFRLKKTRHHGESSAPPPTPITGWRRGVLRGIRYCSRALLFVSGYYWISVKGKRDHKAPILVGNHVGLFESLFVVYAVLPSFIAKKGSEKAPFIGPVMEALQAVLVDRSSVTSR
jgi:hypothetical protein